MWDNSEPDREDSAAEVNILNCSKFPLFRWMTPKMRVMKVGKTVKRILLRRKMMKRRRRFWTRRWKPFEN